MGGVSTNAVGVGKTPTGNRGGSALQDYRITFMERDVIVAHDVPTFKTNDVMYYWKLNHYRKSEGGGVNVTPSTPNTQSVKEYPT